MQTDKQTKLDEATSQIVAELKQYNPSRQFAIEEKGGSLGVFEPQADKAQPQHSGLQEMADAAQYLGMHPDKINAVCDKYTRAVNHADKLAEALRDLLDITERLGPPTILQGTLCEEEDWSTATRASKAALAAYESEAQ